LPLFRNKRSKKLSRCLYSQYIGHRGIAEAPGIERSPSQQSKRRTAMFNKPKFRQAGLILFATAVLLILPNLSRMIG